MKTILRITHTPLLPRRPAREQALKTHFGSDVQFVDWTPPEDPGELFASLCEKLVETEAVAAEVDSGDRFLSALLAIGVAMHAFQVPALEPEPHLATIPILLPILNDGRVTSYVELKDVQPIASERTDIIIS
jgi:hypothetical protein